MLRYYVLLWGCVGLGLLGGRYPLLNLVPRKVYWDEFSPAHRVCTSARYPTAFGTRICYHRLRPVYRSSGSFYARSRIHFDPSPRSYSLGRAFGLSMLHLPSSMGSWVGCHIILHLPRWTLLALLLSIRAVLGLTSYLMAYMARTCKIFPDRLLLRTMSRLASPSSSSISLRPLCAELCYGPPEWVGIMLGLL